MLYKEQVNTRTGERRWIPITGGETATTPTTTTTPTLTPSYQPEETAPAERQTLAQKIGGFLTPVASKTAQIIGGTLGLKSKAQQEAEESQRRAEEMNRLLIQRAKTASPEEKESLLRTSRGISTSLGDISQERLSAAEQAIPIKHPETWSPVKQGVGTAAELGAWLMPALGPKGAGLGQSILRGMATGAPTAGLTALSQTLTEDENVQLNKVITNSLIGSLTGGGIQGAFSLGRSGFKYLTDYLPVVQRRIGLQIPVKETQKALEEADELARETLTKGKYGAKAEQISGGEFKGTPPGKYPALKNWLTDMFGVANKELGNKTVDVSLTIDDIIPEGKQRKVFEKNLERFKKGMELRLEFEGGRGKPIVFKSKKYAPTIDALLAGKPVPFDELNALRSAIDTSQQAMHQTMNKSGATLAEKSGEKAVSLANTANLIRDSLRYHATDDIAELYDIQSFALSFLNRFDKAMAAHQKRLLPSRWELTVLGGLTGGGMATMGSPAVGGVAALGTAAYRLPQLAQVQKFLYGLGKGGAKFAPTIRTVEDLLRKGATVGAGRL